jgi:hypothetical protein
MNFEKTPYAGRKGMKTLPVQEFKAVKLCENYQIALLHALVIYV